MLVSSVLSQSYCGLLHQKSCVLHLFQKNNILTRSMQMKELHNVKKIKNIWPVSLCSQYSAVSTTSLLSAYVSNIWSLMRLRFAVRTSPATLNNLSTGADDGIGILYGT